MQETFSLRLHPGPYVRHFTRVSRFEDYPHIHQNEELFSTVQSLSGHAVDSYLESCSLEDADQQ